ncbi:hypothetical protein, partial [Frankia nepalensis]
FNPPYNELLKEWKVSNPTGAMRQMQAAGFRLLQVHLNGWMGLARFYSQQESELLRSRLISHDIPPEPRRPALRGISATHLSDWRFQAHLVREGSAVFSNLDEYSGVELRVFGNDAPPIRVPPEVALPNIPAPATSPSSRSQDTATRDKSAPKAIRKEIEAAREERRKLEEPLSYPAEPTYDANNGTITIGMYSDGAPSRWYLHSVESGRVEHGLIIGDEGGGKSNALRVVILEAARSQLFQVFPADPSNSNQFSAKWSKAVRDKRQIATNLSGTIRNLELLNRDIDRRNESRSHGSPTRSNPGIIFAIDDADEAFANARVAVLAERIIRDGGEVGIGLVAVVRDVEKLAVHSRGLVGDLIGVRNKIAFMPKGHYILAALSATYGPRRGTVLSKAVKATYVLHWNDVQSTVGQVVGIAPRHYSSDEAKMWVPRYLGENAGSLIEWQGVEGDRRSWWTIDAISARQWYLRWTRDGWTLINVYSAGSGETSCADAIAWAETALEYRFTISLGRWRIGPSTGEENLIALYADTENIPLSKGLAASKVWPTPDLGPA